MEEALVEIEKLRERIEHLAVEGHRQYNPGWHLGLDLRNMLLVSECIARSALERTESRGGHTRDDFPSPDPGWGRVNLVCRADETGVSLKRQPLPQMPQELTKLFD